MNHPAQHPAEITVGQPMPIITLAPLNIRNNPTKPQQKQGPDENRQGLKIPDHRTH
ncbi:hypothetical protein [Stenotrophomonas pigmentata]|uniref:hypothetical protein n=1 Tax=Stenotrophomonas pigmentata TaxID=3055080 RepID=UPI0026F26355|nr:hypothetical protein [Stenotrophomonas sp. 610A2]